MTNAIKREYERLRARGWLARNALDTARINVSFARRDAGTHDKPDATHCVRLRIEPDTGWSFEDLCGDMFNPRANPDIPVSRLEREQEEFRATVNAHGVYGIIGEYWDEAERAWREADSCWGFVGNDLEDNGYDADIKYATLRARLASVRAYRAMCKAAP